MEKDKKVFCYPDILFNEILPQKLQLSIMMDYAKRDNKVIDFYTGENHKSFKQMNLFVKKFKTKPKINGYIFFSFFQFCYSEKVHIDLIKNIVNDGYNLYFVRENFKIETIANFNSLKKDLFYFPETNKKTLNLLKENILFT